jgi:hypothetical protein
VSSFCTVLIAPADLLFDLKGVSGIDFGELLTFSDADALQALDAIMERRPSLVALERQFSETPRGAALVKRIKSDPDLCETEVRIVSSDGEQVTVPDAADDRRGRVFSEPEIVLDRSGTRRAPRYRVDEFVEVLVDGNLASVVDLSTEGAQVLSATVLKPNQRVRVSLSDEEGALRFNASVAWASFEIPPNGGPRYRAGIAFLDADGTQVDSYAQRHRV